MIRREPAPELELVESEDAYRLRMRLEQFECGGVDFDAGRPMCAKLRLEGRNDGATALAAD